MFDFDADNWVEFSKEDLLDRIREDLLERLSSTYQVDGYGNDTFSGSSFQVRVNGTHDAQAWVRGVHYPQQNTLNDGKVEVVMSVGEDRVKFVIEIRGKLLDGGYMFVTDLDSFTPDPA